MTNPMPLMKCGHAAQGYLNKNPALPACIICFGIVPGAIEVAEVPNLEGRTARCSYYETTPTGHLHESKYGCVRGQPCMCEIASDVKLPFFHYKPQSDHDEFYCGCWGWD